MMHISKKNACYILIVIIFLWLLLHISKVSRTTISVPFLSNTETGADSNKGVILIYNRVPKTGSTSLMSVLYALHMGNEFNLAYVNVSTKNHIFSFMNKFRFARNISLWYSFHPALFHGHFPYINFSPMGFRQPIYINVIREPLERFVSHYYFVRYGDTFLPDKVRRNQGDTTTFDDCVKQNSAHCHATKLWLQIPYFCGCENYCWEPGNEKALKRAKENIINSYFLVGTTKNLSKFVEMMESLLPLFFRGATHLFSKNGGTYIRKTKYKAPLKPETVKYFEANKIWQMENKFYSFVETRFLDFYSDFKRAKNQVSFAKLKTKNDD